MNEHTSLVRFNLLTILAGLSFQNGVQMIVTLWSPTVCLNGISFILLIANFYHGKIASTESTEHKELIAGKPKHALVDYALNILVITAFVFMPYYFNNNTFFLITNIVMRCLDFLLVYFMAYWLHDDAPRLVHRAQVFWLRFNLSSILLFTILLVLIHFTTLPQIIVPIAILSSVALDLVLDYTINCELYFGKKAC